MQFDYVTYSLDANGQLTLDDPIKELAAAQPKHIPSRCEWSVPRRIDGAPTPPAATKYEDLMEKARGEIRNYVCRNYRSWPACPCANRPVDIVYRDGYDEKLGDVVIGFFSCGDCGR